MKCLTQEKGNASIPIRLMDETGFSAALNAADEFTKNYVATHDFRAKKGTQILIVDGAGKPNQVWAARDASETESLWEVFARLAEKLPVLRYNLEHDEFDEDAMDQVGLGWALGTYQFSAYKKAGAEESPILELPAAADLNRVTETARAISLARDLINTPAIDLGPEEMCQQASEIAANGFARIRVIRDTELLEQGYPAIFRVGQGSARRPALIDINWGDESHPRVTLVGKGVVFDTGGLNLKPSAGMRWMKKDMGGAAVVLALGQLIMARSLPIRLRVLVPMVENAPGTHAYRPGDVIQTRKGLTVEITNTDAEGRVILGDALAEAAAEKPDLLLDFATLTGACRVALGPDVPGFWTPCDELAQALSRAAGQVADPLWRMPLWHPYRRLLKSDVADLANAASSPMGGAITAALYLHEFVKPLTDWIHLDIFGWNDEKKPGRRKGGEASALRAVYRFLESRYGDRS